MLVFGSRGISRLSLANGDRLQLLAGADTRSVGGELFVAPAARKDGAPARPARLISVSNVCVTAYDLPADPEPATAPSPR
jgi:hypothetical protein